MAGPESDAPPKRPDRPAVTVVQDRAEGRAGAGSDGRSDRRAAVRADGRRNDREPRQASPEGIQQAAAAGRSRRGAARRARPRVSRSEQLQERIKDLILDRGLAAGDPLPTEFDLVDELDVSRNSLREALKALQAVGIVEIRHGFGMYVGRMSLGALVDELAFHGRITRSHDHRDLANVIYVREVLEIGLIRRLIEEHPGADHSEVATVVEQMVKDASTEGSIAPQTDRRFHELLYRPLGNPLVSQLLAAFWEVYLQLETDIGPTDQTADDEVRHHRDIYRAVLAGDAGAAEAAMTAHFDGVRKRLAALETKPARPAAVEPTS